MGRWMKSAGGAMTAACMAVVTGMLWAQQAPSDTGNAPVASNTFEVSTVRPTDPNARDSSLMLNGEKFWTEGQTLKQIMKFAYGLNMSGEQQIVGGPKWIGEKKWDVDAKEDAQTIAAIDKMTRNQRIAQLQMMVQALLAERFHLKTHRETREMPVYALVVAKGGAKITPAKAIPLGADGRPTGGSGLRFLGKGDMEGISAPASLLADELGAQPEIGGKTVIDRTGLPGKYDFELKWSPDMLATSNASDGVSLFTALQEELGLRLEATKAPVEVIVVDSVDEPTAN